MLLRGGPANGLPMSDPMIPKLDQAALEAAQVRCETGHERALVELGILAYNDEAGLVERQPMEDTVDEYRALADERGRYVAALREALGWLLDEVDGYLNTHPDDASNHQARLALAALTYTAQAAALYQPVPKGHKVVPLQITDIQRETALETTGAPSWEDWYDDLYEAAVAAAPVAKPQAGEGTEDDEPFPSRPFTPEDEIDA